MSTDTTPVTEVPRLLVTPEEAAQSLGIGRSLVYELLRSGRLESVQIGACRRIPLGALTAFVEDLRLRPPAGGDGRHRYDTPTSTRPRIWDRPHSLVDDKPS